MKRHGRYTKRSRPGHETTLEAMSALSRYTLVALLCLIGTSGFVQAEVLEEIVAWVNGRIITKSDYDAEEQVVIADAYRQLTGQELDNYLSEVRSMLLLQMIDRKLLVDQAARLYDINVMGDVFLEQFKEKQGITSETEFEQMLQQEGMTIDSVKQKLVEMLAPEEVIRFEVSSRISVSDREVEVFYEENRERFARIAEVTLSEIVLLAKTEEERATKRVEAEAARKRVTEGGEEFGDVARDVSEAGTQADGGALGTLRRPDLAEHLAEPAFSLPVGDVSQVLETPYGFHILKVDARDETSVAPLPEVEEEIRTLLEQVKYADELSAYLEKIRSESEWCVKGKYRELLAVSDARACDTL